ncbi:MAG: hypothetical protein A3I73_03260 [Omnitrophica bacterium RIFCSPLOWO2_02_FULL_45_16]|nr:MAG: hypothetical protein A3C51_02575 [Omnitrophica bacterium RIFCSPHIGHO2_02_FULL_46_20]OGX00353.1 MAG: hypothetical protein A3I73_03260 [Omnitrophica bacterium RIFCSPLOWO2_02_FULL_45_16]
MAVHKILCAIGVALLFFLLLSMAEHVGGLPDAAVKNFDTLRRYRKNFKFLKEVKILSKFFQNKFTCLM